MTEYSKKMMTRSFKKTRYEFREVPEMHFKDDLGIYLHVPFCYTKCTFCPFYKEIYSDMLKERYVDAIVTEISIADISGDSKWIYFGGGTPNTLTIDDLARIVGALNKKVEISNMGIELLPTRVTHEYLDGLQGLGFTKISVGIETFTEETLKKTARRGDDESHIGDLISCAQQLGLYVAVDLMIGLPGQTGATFEEDIRKIIDIRPNQITIYPYMVIRQVKAVPSSTTKEQFEYIEAAAEQLAEADYERKSVWIFVLPDAESEDVYDSSKDELISDYCGFGPASFSTCGDWKVVRPDLATWLHDIKTGQFHAFVASKKKSTDDWRRFANKIYDLKLESTHKFPLSIRIFDFILDAAGYYKDGHLTEKGRYFSHEITKAVVESLPFPIQDSSCIDNYEEYIKHSQQEVSEGKIPSQNH